MTTKKPAHEVRFGSIKAAIWENVVGDGTKFNVTFSRIYKDGEEWKSSDSFGRDDLLLLAKAADQAHSWIYAQRTAREAPVAQRFNNSPAAAQPIRQVASARGTGRG